MTYLVEHPSTTFYSYTDTGVDPLKTAHGVYITVHGHFYQPPRENPYPPIPSIIGMNASITSVIVPMLLRAFTMTGGK